MQSCPPSGKLPVLPHSNRRRAKQLQHRQRCWQSAPCLRRSPRVFLKEQTSANRTRWRHLKINPDLGDCLTKAAKL